LNISESASLLLISVLWQSGVDEEGSAGLNLTAEMLYASLS